MQPSASAQLSVVDLCKHYHGSPGPTVVLDRVCLDVGAGQTLAITGPSGSGKSTLLNIIGSLDTATSGTVRWGEIEVGALAGRALSEYRARQVGFVFQDHHLLPQLTAVENVLLPTLAVGCRSDGAATDRARGLLDRMGVGHRADAFPAQMSGGERQRVAIARALMNGARLLLCDEPTGNLDQTTGRQIVELFLELAGRDGVTVLMVTHNLELAGRLHRCLELRGGKLAPAGQVAQAMGGTA